MTLAFLIILPLRAIREQQAVPAKPSDCVSSARQLEGVVFYLTAAFFFLVSKPRNPPKLLRRRYQNCESLRPPRASPLRVAPTADPRWGFPPGHREPWNQTSGHHFVFLAVAPAFSSALVPAFVLQRLAPLRFCAADSQPQTERGPSRLLLFFFFSPCSRLWLLPLQAGSPKTHDSLTMNNQYRY